MAEQNECETCDGRGVLIGDRADHRGERIDDVLRCPDCAPEPYERESPDDKFYEDYARELEYRAGDQ